MERAGEGGLFDVVLFRLNAEQAIEMPSSIQRAYSGDADWPQKTAFPLKPLVGDDATSADFDLNNSGSTQHVFIDTTVPTDTTSVPSGWQTAPLSVAVTGYDATSGIQKVDWQLDGGSVQSSTSNPTSVRN